MEDPRFSYLDDDDMDIVGLVKSHFWLPAGILLSGAFVKLDPNDMIGLELDGKAAVAGTIPLLLLVNYWAAYVGPLTAWE